MCLTFFLDEKSNKKIKTDARFTRKTCARKAKILQTPPCGRQTRSIFALFSFVFWLSELGHSLTSCVQFDFFHVFIENNF